MESIANYSALQLLEEKEGAQAIRPLLDQFRKDLLLNVDGKAVESRGPVDFGFRLLEAQGENVWHAIVYEKGTWILHMLRERMGEEGFQRMQVELLRQYAGKPFTNENSAKQGAVVKWVRVVSGSNPMPEGAAIGSCRLPSMSDYLYVE